MDTKEFPLNQYTTPCLNVVCSEMTAKEPPVLHPATWEKDVGQFCTVNNGPGSGNKLFVSLL
jgi:hypothetical protein